MECAQRRFVGIDLSKRTYEAVALYADTDTITRWNGKLDPKGRAALLKKLAHGDIVAMEAGTASFKIAKELQSRNGFIQDCQRTAKQRRYYGSGIECR